jgi:hypothetical protein
MKRTKFIAVFITLLLASFGLAEDKAATTYVVGMTGVT